eukprot:TRINITY_DN84586_c0_g1_i16.p1 TRINITY_DN84586_c0_g1~~TRINITY_DN84586_c0_g1_i16.p1  ORF type:complete len:314 (-),score=20.14 TRINITY_DN84586_c0_g1_i16:1159-2100(-)
MVFTSCFLSQLHINSSRDSSLTRHKKPRSIASFHPSKPRTKSVRMKADNTSYLISGARVTVHTVTVPLDHSGQVSGSLSICVREMTIPNRKYAAPMLYLNGGPGMECTKPNDYLGWMKCALSQHSRLFLMDQRGTGNSCPITIDNLKRVGTVQQQADYLKFFRADSIVRDAEIVRKQLLSSTDDWGGKWSLLGQSFGGFCITTYLSLCPEGVCEAYITGGIPPCIDSPCCAEQVYMKTFQRVRAQNQKYYVRFPGDVEKVGKIVKYLAAQPNGGLQLRDGSLLTPRLFQVWVAMVVLKFCITQLNHLLINTVT